LIFVTVGSAQKGVEFTRLIKKMDEVASRTGEEVLMQIGSVPYEPQHAPFFRYCSYQESLEYFKNASLVVGHCGTGTILNAMRFHVPIIVVPRRIVYGELHHDDHQLEIAERVEGMALIHVAYEIEDLEREVQEALQGNKATPTKPSFPEREKLVKSLRSFLESCP
jgi:UDP-N-acetylglucosamine transferase subunit ALG13